MLGVVLRATEALLALRFPGFSRFERSQDESVMDLVLGGDGKRLCYPLQRGTLF